MTPKRAGFTPSHVQQPGSFGSLGPFVRAGGEEVGAALRSVEPDHAGRLRGIDRDEANAFDACRRGNLGYRMA